MRVRFPLVLAAVAALVAGPAAAARHYPPGVVPPSHGPGKLIPVLDDGTLREPSIDRAESVDEPDSLAKRQVQWDVTPASATTDRIGTLDKQGLGAGEASLTYGLGGGADIGVRAGAWERTRIDLPNGAGTETASGFGATTVTLGRTVRPATWGGGSARYAAFARFPGATAGPGPTQAEMGAQFALARPLGDAAQVAIGATPAWVGNALDSGHHFELAAGILASHDLGDHASLWLEGVSVSYSEANHPWLGVVDAGLRLDVAHVGLTLGAAAGNGGGHHDVGALARIGVHS